MIYINSNKNILLSIVMIVSIVFTTIVYAAFNTQLTIEGEAIVRSDQDIRITNISVINRTNGAYETYNNKYNKDVTFMYATLPSNSSITYEVQITNKVNYPYYVKSIAQQSHTNQNVNIEVSLNNFDKINSNQTKTFTIKMTNNTGVEQIETLLYKYEFINKIYASEISYSNINTSLSCGDSQCAIDALDSLFD